MVWDSYLRGNNFAKIVYGRHVHVLLYLGVVSRGARSVHVGVSLVLTVDMSSAFIALTLCSGANTATIKAIWTPRVEKILHVEQSQAIDIHYPYAVAVLRQDVDSDSVVTI